MSTHATRIPDAAEIREAARRFKVGPGGVGEPEDFGDAEVGQAQRAFALLNNPAFYKKTTKYPDFTSYGLKHQLERTYKALINSQTYYICNGAAIVAAKLCGVKHKTNSDSSNAALAIKPVFTLSKYEKLFQESRGKSSDIHTHRFNLFDANTQDESARFLANINADSLDTLIKTSLA